MALILLGIAPATLGAWPEILVGNSGIVATFGIANGSSEEPITSGRFVLRL